MQCFNFFNNSVTKDFLVKSLQIKTDLSVSNDSENVKPNFTGEYVLLHYFSKPRCSVLF